MALRDRTNNKKVTLHFVNAPYEMGDRTYVLRILRQFGFKDEEIDNLLKQSKTQPIKPRSQDSVEFRYLKIIEKNCRSHY